MISRKKCYVFVLLMFKVTKSINLRLLLIIQFDKIETVMVEYKFKDHSFM